MNIPHLGVNLWDLTLAGRGNICVNTFLLFRSKFLWEIWLGAGTKLRPLDKIFLI